MQAGSALVIIVPVDWFEDQTLVRIFSIINLGAPVAPELTKFLATENAKLLFDKFSLDEINKAISYELNLLGDFLNRKELEVAVKSIAFTADKYDDEIKATFGGKMLGEF